MKRGALIRATRGGAAAPAAAWARAALRRQRKRRRRRRRGGAPCVSIDSWNLPRALATLSKGSSWGPAAVRLPGAVLPVLDHTRLLQYVLACDPGRRYQQRCDSERPPARVRARAPPRLPAPWQGPSLRAATEGRRPRALAAHVRPPPSRPPACRSLSGRTHLLCTFGSARRRPRTSSPGWCRRRCRRCRRRCAGLTRGRFDRGARGLTGALARPASHASERAPPKPPLWP